MLDNMNRGVEAPCQALITALEKPLGTGDREQAVWEKCLNANPMRRELTIYKV